jgi:hypothetical protein
MKEMTSVFQKYIDIHLRKTVRLNLSTGITAILFFCNIMWGIIIIIIVVIIIIIIYTPAL